MRDDFEVNLASVEFGVGVYNFVPLLRGDSLASFHVDNLANGGAVCDHDRPAHFQRGDRAEIRLQISL